MKLHSLATIQERSKKRLGRGTSSGKGKTSARGMKGQKARGKVPLGFIGGTLPLYRKLPMARGRGGRGGHNMRSRSLAVAINVAKLSSFDSGAEITIASLIDKKLVDSGKATKYGVKIVGKNGLDKSLTVAVSVSSGSINMVLW
jgi:large subunit ribosomal protein L15